MARKPTEEQIAKRKAYQKAYRVKRRETLEMVKKATDVRTNGNSIVIELSHDNVQRIVNAYIASSF